MIRKSNLLIVCVVLFTVLVASSGNATKTVETIPATATTVVLCDPPEHLYCASADLSNANLLGAFLDDANLTGTTMRDGTIHD